MRSVPMPKHCYNQVAKTKRSHTSHDPNCRRNALREFYFVRTAIEDLRADIAVNSASLRDAMERKSKRAPSRAHRIEQEIGVKSAAVDILEADAFKLSITVKHAKGHSGNGFKQGDDNKHR